MPVVSEMPPVSPSPARTSSRAVASPTAGAKVEYRERERRRSSRGATERDESKVKEEPRARWRVKQEPLDDPVVAHVKQEPHDDPDAEDNLRAKWEAELDVKQEEDDEDPDEDHDAEDDAYGDEEDEEEDGEGDDITEEQSGVEGYGTAEEDADLVTQFQSQTGETEDFPLPVPDGPKLKSEPPSPSGTRRGIAVKREAGFEDPQNGAGSSGGPFAWSSSSPFEETSRLLYRRLGQIDAEMASDHERQDLPPSAEVAHGVAQLRAELASTCSRHSQMRRPLAWKRSL